MFGTRFPEEYDAEADALYVRFQQGANVAHTEEVEGDIFVDLDDRGIPIGLEILNPANHRATVMTWLESKG